MLKIKLFVILVAILGLVSGPLFAAPSISPLFAQEAALHDGATHVVSLEYDDFTETATNTAETVALFSVPADCIVEVVYTVLVAPFADSSDTNHLSDAVTIGDGASAARFLASQELNAGGTEVNIKGGVIARYNYTSADTVDAVLTPTAISAASTLTSGELKIYCKIFTK